jgi:hypothetical protein
MDIQQLEESVRGFQPPGYGRVQRSGESYQATEEFVRQEVAEAVDRYRGIERLDQTARLLRDKIEAALRRYHGYGIKERIRAHYFDSTIQPHEKKGIVFEHVIPVRYLVALLLQDRISVSYAMHPPTCLLRKAQDTLLEKLGLGDRTPDMWNFWQRYQALGIDIVTHDGTVVDQTAWTLGDHYRYFKVSAY